MICMIKEAIDLHPRHADVLHTVAIFKTVQVCIRVCVYIHIYIYI